MSNVKEKIDKERQHYCNNKRWESQKIEMYQSLSHVSLLHCEACTRIIFSSYYEAVVSIMCSPHCKACVSIMCSSQCEACASIMTSAHCEAYVTSMISSHYEACASIMCSPRSGVYIIIMYLSQWLVYQQHVFITIKYVLASYIHHNVKYSPVALLHPFLPKIFFRKIASSYKELVHITKFFHLFSDHFILQTIIVICLLILALLKIVPANYMIQDFRQTIQSHIACFPNN